MQFDWVTFVLEILNFLILIWILSRFLYQPILKAIAQRKSSIEHTVNESERIKREAESLRGQYEGRLADWEQEKKKAREQLVEDLNQERVRLQEHLKSSLEQEREKAKVLDARRLREERQHLEGLAVSYGGQFVSRLMTRLASPELEKRLVRLVLNDIRDLSEEQRQDVLAACSEKEVSVKVSTVFPLDQPDREAIVTALTQLIGRPVSCEWIEDPQLVTGLRIGIGPWVLGANLHDELKFFAETSHGTTASPASS